MLKEVVEELLDEVGLEYKYHHFEVEEAIAPPFICWIVPDTDNFAADGKVFFKGENVHIELYTDKKDFELELRIETVLDEKELYWDKTEDYIESEKMYMVTYILTV